MAQASVARHYLLAILKHFVNDKVNERCQDPPNKTNISMWSKGTGTGFSSNVSFHKKNTFIFSLQRTNKMK